MQIREFSELLLREATLAAERPQASPEQDPWIRTWHHGIMRSLTTMSLQDIINLRKTGFRVVTGRLEKF